MNSYQAEILFCFRIMASSSSDFAYLPTFSNPQQETIEQTSSNQQINNQPMFNREKKNILDKIIDSPSSRTLRHIFHSRAASHSCNNSCLIAIWSSCKSDCNLVQYKKRNALKFCQFCPDISKSGCADISLTGA